MPVTAIAQSASLLASARCCATSALTAPLFQGLRIYAQQASMKRNETKEYRSPETLASASCIEATVWSLAKHSASI
jgi:hypothetical protein